MTTLDDEEIRAILATTSGHVGPEYSNEAIALHVLHCARCSATVKVVQQIMESRRGYGCTVCSRSDRPLHPAAWWVKDSEGRLVGQTIVRGCFCSYLCFEVWALVVERDELADEPCQDCGAPMTTDGRCLLLEKHKIEEDT